MKDATLYEEVARHIREAIEGGELRAGQKLPPILSLSEQHGVSHTTIRAALRDLAAQGFVESRQGSGVYVRKRDDAGAASGVLARDGLLACVMPGEGNAFFASLMRGIERVARQNGFRVLFANAQNSGEEEERQIEELRAQVAGFLIVPASNGSKLALYHELRARQLPFVFVDFAVRGVTAPLVATDNERGGFLAAQHLLALDRGPVFALATSGPTSMEERLRGFERAVRQSGRAFDPQFIRLSAPQMPSGAAGFALVQELVASGQRPPFGLVALNEDIARGAYAALQSARLRVPLDVAVVGYDDTQALFFDPPLSAVRQDFCEMGARATQLLIEQIRFGAGGRQTGERKRKSGEVQIRLAPRLVVRNSSDANSDFSLSNHFRFLAEAESASLSAK